MKISIPWAKPVFYGKEKLYVNEALDSTWISGGKFINVFEELFCKQHGIEYGLSTSNGTTALFLALLALGIGEGDEVILPGFCFVAPSNMVITVGAKPVYADVDINTWCIDPDSILTQISSKTKAIIVVHTYGNVCDMEKVESIANKFNLLIIEDGAEAAFSKYKNKLVGTFGDAGCFSFQATKTITMGEGGFVLSKNKEVLENMILIRDHGMSKEKRYWHTKIGHNFRLTNLQAALGVAQLENIEIIRNLRKNVYKTYCKYLNGINGVILQKFNKEVDPVVWAIAVRIIGDKKRDEIMNHMLRKGIETRPGFYTFASMPLYNTHKLKNSEVISENIISFPSYPTLKEDEIKYICETFINYINK